MQNLSDLFNMSMSSSRFWDRLQVGILLLLRCKEESCIHKLFLRQIEDEATMISSNIKYLCNATGRVIMEAHESS